MPDTATISAGIPPRRRSARSCRAARRQRRACASRHAPARLWAPCRRPRRTRGPRAPAGRGAAAGGRRERPLHRLGAPLSPAMSLAACAGSALAFARAIGGLPGPPWSVCLGPARAPWPTFGKC